ncbi:MAG: M28 family peptidase [Candidatus Omnitrophica bacterium]|nr:M28 family peptidase [Candidatus Omnitrophota bacterium]
MPGKIIFLNLAKRIGRLLIVAVITIALCKVTSFGWKFWSGSPLFRMADNNDVEERLKSHVYKLSEEIGDINFYNLKGLEEAADYISGQFASYGYKVEFQTYEINGIKVKNIIAVKKGAKNPDRFIVVGAHYDNYFNPGADDNASGVAGLLEIARLAADCNSPDSIRFVAFVNEEPPFFKTANMGSRVYAGAMRLKGEDIKGGIILEMIGYYSNKPFSQRYPPVFGLFYPNKGNFIGVLANFNSWQLAKEVASGLKRRAQLPVESVVTFDFIGGIDFSDNGSFWKEGFPSVMVTDTASYRSKYYHTQSDTYDTLNYKAMAEVVRGICFALGEIDKK